MNHLHLLPRPAARRAAAAVALVLGLANAGLMAGALVAPPGLPDPPGLPGLPEMPDVPEATDWARDYAYAVPVVVEHRGEALRDYPLRITLDTAALIEAGKLRADCADLRFLDLPALAALPHWVEGACGSTDTTVWVRLDAIPAAPEPRALLMLYGHPEASSASDCAATLDVCSTFDRDMDGWQDAETGNAACQASYPAAVPDGGQGRPAGSVRKGPEQGSAYLCRAGISRTLALPGNVHLAVRVDFRATSTFRDSGVTNAHAAVHEGRSIELATRLHGEMLVAGGLDSGWRAAPGFQAATLGHEEVTLFLHTQDAWLSNWGKTVWFDNVQARRVADPEPVSVLGPEVPNPLAGGV